MQVIYYVPDLEDAESDIPFNTFGVLSVIGLECIEDPAVHAKLLKGLYDYATDKLGSWTFSFREEDPSYGITVNYNKGIDSVTVNWGDGSTTSQSKYIYSMRMCVCALQHIACYCFFIFCSLCV